MTGGAIDVRDRAPRRPKLSPWQCGVSWSKTPAPVPCSGAHRGSVRVAEGVDLTAPVLDVTFDAATGRKGER
jgi:hypothetical protein